MLEKRIEARLKAALEARGALVYKFISPGQAGVPDRLAVLPGGRCIFIELKQDAGQLGALQMWQLKRLRDRGVEAYVIRGTKDLKVALQALDERYGLKGASDGV